MSCNVDVKFDSLKLTISPILNSVDDKSEISISVAETLLTIWATEPLSLPIIFSPNILLVSNPNPEGNVNLSNVVELDDNTDLSGELACAGGSCEIDIDLKSLEEVNES